MAEFVAAEALFFLIATRRHFTALAIAAALAGCATGDPLTNDLLTQRIAPGTPRKSVCIISGIGDTFALQKKGITVFGNALDQAPIDAWGIDDFVAGKIAAQLGQRFDVKRVGYPKGAFAALEKVKSPLSGDTKNDSRKDLVRGIVASQKCDLCIVVTKTVSGIGSSNQAIFGLGILDVGSVIADNVILFAVTEIRVYDGQTFAVLARKWTYDWQKSFIAGISAPHRQVDKSWWPASPAQVAQDMKLKQATMELVEKSVTAMIADLFPPS